mmetsp:Transcript_23521/g.65430  ORF Transcript_23521/g.65430 Transcript_23521/m.65430 type:complete len:295 (+) Transcript_23521:69-953(+)|eukprot:CAMPEP_0168734288 /NCGR_PEP_ID=MMETSP0724-20121128/8733_1 /TAXON_ID=265536 /ORGANISM="Amphiprora sp., Strain CCMP467" /LENGTH=294 /DNA_ID=CAMNT_0008781381 /DNA_START=59 /DNA_END=943 /DNA_ORIENTATION=-
MEGNKGKISHFFASSAQRADESKAIPASPDVIVIDDEHDDPPAVASQPEAPITEQEITSPQSSISNSSNMATNPFAQFAAASGKTTTNFAQFAALGKSRKRTLDSFSALKTQKPRTVYDAKRSKPGIPKKKKPADWVKMKDLDSSEQERVVKKWHSLIQPDNQEGSSPYSLEDKRFQVFVAARIHARCQEPAVRRAMQALNEAMPITVEQFATRAKQEDIANAIKNLQFFRVKAKELCTAAQQLKSNHHSKVPEDERDLKQLMGIGPCLSDLLAFVNTRERHQQQDEGPAQELR